MPLYEFKCHKCGETFTVAESIAAREKRAEKCPKCNSNEVERVLGEVSVKTAKKTW